MARKKFRYRRFRHFLSVLLLLAMFCGTLLLPPTFAEMTAANSTLESLPDAQKLLEEGRKFYESERFAQAVSSWQQAISAFKARGDRLKLAMTLGNLSLAYQQLGRWAEGESAIAQSLNLLETTQNINAQERSQILAQALDIKGRLQLAQNKAEDALNTWQVSADIYKKIGDNTAIIRNRVNQAQALQALGFYRQAEKTLRETTKILQSQPNSPLKVAGLRSLGNVVQVTGDLETSRQILQQSLAAASSLPDRQAIGDILLSLGNTARAQQDVPAAMEFYQKAATTATSPTTRIQAEVNQLRLLVETEKFDALQALSSQIQNQLSELPPSRTAISARINFAESLTQLKKKTAQTRPHG